MNATSRVGGPGRLEIDIKGKSYQGASGATRTALGRVAFTLGAGKVGAILGPSGCGKTTLLRIVAGLETRFDGTIVRPERGRLGVVFQEPRLLPWRDVEQNVRLAAPAAEEIALAGLFDALGLGQHRRHFPGELSLGLARRVALARALAARPDLLLLDEPLASLDAATASRMIDEITVLLDARPVTTLLVTHDTEAAIRLADIVFVLSEGPAHLLASMAISEPRRKVSASAARAIADQIEAARSGAAKVALVSPLGLGAYEAREDREDRRPFGRSGEATK